MHTLLAARHTGVDAKGGGAAAAAELTGGAKAPSINREESMGEERDQCGDCIRSCTSEMQHWSPNLFTL